MSADCTLQRCYSTFYINTQRIGIQIRQNLLFRVCRFQRGVHEPERKQRVQKDEEKKLSVPPPVKLRPGGASTGLDRSIIGEINMRRR